ncbi:MAG: glutathione binding-like protein, partial [Caulobacterales bacterium]|nr:glutathione binding-like protein [Caulobacterales bacterium]
RAEHDQWVAFILSEVEAHLWSTARNTALYPEEMRVPQIVEQNNAELTRALSVLDAHLREHDYLVEDRFTVTDIFAGYAANWACRSGVTEGLAHLHAYTQRLLDRPLCPYRKE